VEHDLKDLQPHDGSQVQFGSFIELDVSGVIWHEEGRCDLPYEIGWWGHSGSHFVTKLLILVWLGKE
jgi:hypothetical protein